MLAGNVIIKLYECNNKFHLVTQGYSGKVCHHIFKSEADARTYLATLNILEVPCERI